MASKAQAGRGTVVSISNTPFTGTTPTFTVIGEVTNSSLKSPKFQYEEVTSFDSGSDMEYLATIRGDGSVTLTFNRVSSDAGQLLLQAAGLSGALYAFKIVLPKTAAQTTKGDEYDFNAYVPSPGDFDVKPTSKVSGSIDLKISGPVTLTAGS